MRVFLVRHASAAPGTPDEERSLTAEGRAEADRSRRATGGRESRCSRLEPSPPRRETAAAVATGREGSSLRRIRDSPRAPRWRVCETPSTGTAKTVVAIGHQPDCGNIFEELTGERRPFPNGRVCGARAVSAIVVRDLRKSYGATEAVRGIDFTIEAGEVFGLLGPNGAGKTTTVEILEGYRTARRWNGRSARSRPRERRITLARAGRRRAAVLVAVPEPDGRREPAAVRRVLRDPAGSPTRWSS